MFLITKMNFDVSVNQAVWLVVPTPFTFFKGGYSYLTHCLPEVNRSVFQLMTIESKVKVKII